MPKTLKGLTSLESYRIGSESVLVFATYERLPGIIMPVFGYVPAYHLIRDDVKVNSKQLSH